MRPLLKWAGGKSRLAPLIATLFPERFVRYVEPFIGGGAVFLSVAKAQEFLISDSNPELINLYQVVRDSPLLLARALDGLQVRYSESFYYELRNQIPEKKVARAARLVFLNKTCFNGLYRENSKGEFNVSFGKRKRCPELYDKQNLFSISEKLKTTDIVCKDFRSVLVGCGKGDVVYCDPPYVPLSATSCFQSYTSNRFTVERHRQLEEECRLAAKRGATVLVSNSNSALSLGLYRGWKTVSVQAKRAINCRGDLRGDVKEIIALIDSSIEKRSFRRAELVAEL